MIWLILGGVAAALILLQRLTFVSASTAQRYLSDGALIVDVRSPEEFRSGKVPGAVNLPLGELTRQIARVAPDQQKPILVHCLSGGRSAMAQRQLKRLGYTQVFNLGSLSRAQSIIKGCSRS